MHALGAGHTELRRCVRQSSIESTPFFLGKGHERGTILLRSGSHLEPARRVNHAAVLVRVLEPHEADVLQERHGVRYPRAHRSYRREVVYIALQASREHQSEADKRHPLYDNQVVMLDRLDQP